MVSADEGVVEEAIDDDDDEEEEEAALIMGLILNEQLLLKFGFWIENGNGHGV